MPKINTKPLLHVAQMAAGTAEIRASLGDEASKVTTQQIQEALWHYYYDVDKSIAYLMNKFIAPTPKVAKATKKQKGGQFTFPTSRPTSTPEHGETSNHLVERQQSFVHAGVYNGHDKQSF